MTQPSRLDTFLNSDLVKKINKATKRSVIQRASEFRQDTPSRIPTGIFPVDYALGGGFPVGRISLVWGPKASCKTSMFLKAIANAQKMCANCWIPHDPISGNIMCGCKDYRPPIIAYMDVEGAIDFSWASMLGVNSKNMIYIVPDYAEEAIDVCDALLRGGECDILVIDSLAVLIPLKEAEESMEKGMMGDQSRLIGRAIRKFVGALNSVGNESNRRPTLFLINQIRQKLTMFGDPVVQPGGMAPGFMASIEMRTFAGKYPEVDAGQIPKYVDLNFRMEKNKVGPSRMEGNFRLTLMDSETKKKGQIQDEPQIMKFLEMSGLLDRKGNRWFCSDREFTHKSLVEKAITTEPAFSHKVRKELMKHLLESYFAGTPIGDGDEAPEEKPGADAEMAG